jgi:dipeptidyl aminopeptidase/acylaminoacyl peptidase
MKPSIVVVASAAAILAASANVNAAPLTLQALRGLVGISDVNISRDGSKVAFVRAIGDYQHDKWNRAVVVVSTKGGVPREVTSVMHTLSSPQWSPSGDRIAFIANDKKETAQLYVVPASGGKPLQLTHTEKDVEQYSWSPDGSQIAYVTEDGPSNPAAAARDDNLWEVHDDGVLTKNDPRPSHIWLVSSNGGNARRLTGGSWSVLEAAPPFVGLPTNPTWSADGRTIAFTMQSDADDSDSDRTSIAKVDVATGRVSKIDARTQYEYQPLFAPRGDALAYLYPHGPGPISVLDVFVAGDGTNVDDTSYLDRDVTQVAWLANDRLIALAANGVRESLYVIEDGTVRMITHITTMQALTKPLAIGDLNPTEISASADGKIAMIASASNLPAEVYVLDSLDATPRKLTNLNAAVARLDYGKSEEITWTAPDGERSDGVLTYPVGYQPGKKYPLVLRIHGGPEASTVMNFETLRQLFAGRGNLVFQPNYRGSDNLGTAHEHAIYKDPGIGPGDDVMAGVKALEAKGIVDESREAVTGHSYGGYMTTWMIGHYHNWRCAVVGDGMVDWVEEYNLSATGNLAWTRDSLGGSPWLSSNAAVYRDGSPITYVHDIKTPTRIISGTADEQVPVTESYELYHALKDLGVPVSFIAIPGAKHFPDDPVHIEGYNRVTLEWVDLYMK